MKISRGSGNLFRDLGFPPEEAQKLLLRSDLMMRIERYVKTSGLKQKDAAAPPERSAEGQDRKVQSGRAGQHARARRHEGRAEREEGGVGGASRRAATASVQYEGERRNILINATPSPTRRNPGSLARPVWSLSQGRA